MKLSIDKTYLLIFILFMSACSEMNVSITQKDALNSIVPNPPTDTIPPTLTVNQAVLESIGSCSFTASPDPTNRTEFSFRVTFSERIQPLTFTISDIVNTGTGGSVTLDWSLQSCGDGRNFKLIADDVEGNGTIIPIVSTGAVEDLAGNFNLATSATDNSITFLRHWVQEAYIKAPNSDSDDNFGSEVSIDGDTLVVSAIGEDSNETTITSGTYGSVNNDAPSTGAIYVYGRAGNIWTQEAFIKAANSDLAEEYGFSMSLNRDTLAIGASHERSNQSIITNGTTASPDNTLTSSGAVYIYKRTLTSWSQEAYIKVANQNINDYFGSSVSVHGDTLVVGAYGEDSNVSTILTGTTTSGDNSSDSSGAAYVFKRTGNIWTQEAFLKQSINHSFANFGQSVAVEGDRIMVGAYRTNASGIVAVFERTGSTWTEVELIESTIPFTAVQFGRTISLSDDTIAIAAPLDETNDNTITNGPGYPPAQGLQWAGAVSIFRRSGATWTQEAFIKPSNPDTWDLFGEKISLEKDTLVVGVKYESSNQTTITEGDTASSDNSSAHSGAVYVFGRKGVEWSQKAFIKATNASAGDYFGGSVSLSGDTIVTGAIREDSAETTITNGVTASLDDSKSNSGAVYVYRYNGKLFDVSDVWGEASTSSITLRWHRTGGLATGYTVSYRAGAVPPLDCSSNTVVSLGNVGTYLLSSLPSATTYSFRVCATDRSDITAGSTLTMATN